MVRIHTLLSDGLGHATWSASFSLLNTVILAKSPFYFRVLVALKLLVSLISRLIACSVNNKRRQTHSHTDQLQ